MTDNTANANAKVKAPAVITVSRTAMQSAADVVAPASGAPAKVERFAAVLAPLLSTYIVSGGNSVELTSPDNLKVNQTHSPAAKQLWASKGHGKRAFAMLIVHARGHGPKGVVGSQVKHDAAIAAFELDIVAAFVQPAKAKLEGPAKETDKQIVARLTAEIIGLKIERDSLQAALQAVKIPAMA